MNVARNITLDAALQEADPGTLVAAREQFVASRRHLLG